MLACSQSRWNPGRYSLLAGFVEIGETFEMAVAREVKEESGIDIDQTSVRCLFETLKWSWSLLLALKKEMVCSNMDFAF